LFAIKTVPLYTRAFSTLCVLTGENEFLKIRKLSQFLDVFRLMNLVLSARRTNLPVCDLPPSKKLRPHRIINSGIKSYTKLPTRLDFFIKCWCQIRLQDGINYSMNEAICDVNYSALPCKCSATEVFHSGVNRIFEFIV